LLLHILCEDTCWSARVAYHVLPSTPGCSSHLLPRSFPSTAFTYVDRGTAERYRCPRPVCTHSRATLVSVPPRRLLPAPSFDLQGVSTVVVVAHRKTGCSIRLNSRLPGICGVGRRPAAALWWRLWIPAFEAAMHESGCSGSGGAEHRPVGISQRKRHMDPGAACRKAVRSEHRYFFALSLGLLLRAVSASSLSSDALSILSSSGSAEPLGRPAPAPRRISTRLYLVRHTERCERADGAWTRILVFDPPVCSVPICGCYL